MTSGDEISELDIVSQWCAAGEQGDAGKAVRCLAPGVELISPLTEQFRFVGLEQVRELLHAAFAVIDDIQFHTRWGLGRRRLCSTELTSVSRCSKRRSCCASTPPA